MKRMLLMMITAAGLITACGGGQRFTDDPNGGLSASGDSSDITSISIERFTDACTMTDGDCGGCRATVTYISDLSATYEDSGCEETASITQSDWDDMVSVLEADDFMDVIAEECDTSEIGFYAGVIYSVVTQDETEYSSIFYCNRPGNISDVYSVLSNPIEDLFSENAAIVWGNLN